MKHHVYSAFAIATAAAMTLACSQADPSPTGPSSPASAGTEALADGSTLKVTAPTPVSPSGGAEVSELDLVINNAAPRFVQSLPLSYVFEVRDSQNRLVYQSSPIPQGGGGRTTHEIATILNPEEVHTWRAYAVYQSRRGPMSAAESFKTFNRYGVSCAGAGSEQAIVECRRAQYDHIPHDELPEFLRKVAYDLNRSGAEHAPYGLLVKNTGNNCHGYSCDIICAGQGSGQRQWDVLRDEDGDQAPGWSRVGDAFTRPCEYVE